MAGASRDFTALLATTLQRSASKEAAYAIAVGPRGGVCRSRLKADMSNIAVFQNVFGHSPVVRVFCPGRVNLIGEHIDYHGYGVFPIATEEGTETLAAPNGKGIIRIANVNEQYPEHTVSLPFEWSGASPPKWYDYVLCGWKGVMERLNCDQIGFDLLVEGSIPPSSGLSSSSSLVCSAALTAWMIHTKETFESIRKEDLADLCAIAEHYVGTHGGGMDQAAEVLAVKGSALRIDFFPLKSRVISLPPLASFVVLHCGEALNKAATSHYNERVSEGRLAGKLLLKNHGTGTNPRSWRLKDVQEALGKTLEEMLELCECLPVEAPREQLEDLLTKEVVAECLTSNTQHWDGLPVSAEPGPTHNILVSRTSIRPKTCNQVTGRCKGGGLESPPTNKLHMSTPGERKFSQKLMGLEACNLPMGFKISLHVTVTEKSLLIPEESLVRSDDAKKIKYDVIGLTETRRHHPLNAVYETGEELFLGKCDRGVSGVGVLVNTSMAKNLDSFEQLTTRIGCLRMRRCGPTSALTIFVAYAPTSSYEEVEAFYMELEKFYREDHAFYKVIGEFNAKVDPRRTPEELHIGTHGLQWSEQGERFCLTYVAVVPKFYTGSDHRFLRGRFSFTRREEKAAKFRERDPRTIINWDLFATLAGFSEGSAKYNIDEEYDRHVKHLHDCTKKFESFKTTKRRLYLETIELIRQRGAARAAGNSRPSSQGFAGR
ncbi:hypothetical protein RB195_006391 [Necator americanus]|uniref:Galactokinase n=1 Tax=Necator americanus TaxID=51031 RepID=A0ABR1BTV6_NECAM